MHNYLKKLQVAIFISGRGSNLESLIQSSFTKQSLVEVQLVVSNNSKAKGLTIAKKNKIPFIHFIPRKNFENRVMKYLKNIDIIFMQFEKFNLTFSVSYTHLTLPTKA